MTKNVLGIDLGTTFSSVSVILSEMPNIVKDNLNQSSIPSIVNFKKKDDKLKDIIEITVGSDAKKRKQSAPKKTVYDSKRMLGKKFKDEQIQKLKSRWPFNIEESESSGILICLEGVEKKYQPYEISGEILKYLAELGNSRFPVEERTKDVIITIPANFGDEQRTETIKAAEYAGLHVLQLINEPTAAGLAFGLQNRDQNAKSRYIFVFDFGGGTLDVSLLEQKGKNIEVKATDGDMFLGGQDFDDNTVNFLINELNLGKIINKKPKKMDKLYEAVIDAKKDLSVRAETTINLVDIINNGNDDDDDDEDEDNSYNLTLAKFEQINAELIDRILIPVERLLNSSGKRKEDISTILLVGGSSRMQFVKRKLKDYFGKEPFAGVDPEEAVAIGAAIVGSKYDISISSKSLVKSLNYKDICPFSIGSPDVNGKMIVLIPKGTSIPSPPKTKQFQTVLYKQDIFTVTIFEGENEYVYDNLRLGEFKITNLPQDECEICFNVTFQIDTNGILHASAQLVGGELHAEAKIKIEKSEARLSRSIKLPRRVDPNVNNLKIFYMNIQRFINFNREKFEKVYPKNTIDSFILKAEDQEINADSIEEHDINVHIQNYKYTIFKQYFRKFHTIPSFLRE